MSSERLVTMSNQIAAFFGAQKRGDAAEAVANHIVKFWDPEMRRQFAGIVAADDPRLTPLSREAGRRVAAQLRPDPADAPPSG